MAGPPTKTIPQLLTLVNRYPGSGVAVTWVVEPNGTERFVNGLVRPPGPALNVTSAVLVNTPLTVHFAVMGPTAAWEVVGPVGTAVPEPQPAVVATQTTRYPAGVARCAAAPHVLIAKEREVGAPVPPVGPAIPTLIATNDLPPTMATITMPMSQVDGGCMASRSLAI